MTVRQWIKETAVMIEDLSRFDIEVLVSERIEIGRASLLAHLDDELDEAIGIQLEKDREALLQHTPLQYVLGRAYFMDATYKVTPDVLIPRFDTEYLVQAILDCTSSEEADVLDLCTGSGIIAISLGRARKKWSMHASDFSEAALSVAKENGQQLCQDIDWRQGDLWEPWQNQRFDIIVSNPPYIDRSEYASLSEQVHQEPEMALFAEHNGLAFYERICEEAEAYLKPDGLLAVEIGCTQGPMVMQLFRENHFIDIQCLQDGQQLDRVVIGRVG